MKDALRIPEDIWFDEALTLSEKLMLVKIKGYGSKSFVFYASNAHLADFFKVGENRIGTILKALRFKGYIKSHIEFKGNIYHRRICTYLGKPTNTKTIVPIVNKRTPPSLKMVSTPPKECLVPLVKGVSNSKELIVKVNSEVLIKPKKVDNYFIDLDLDDIFKEFLDLRKSLKAKNTDRAVKLILKKLEGLDKNIQIAMLEQSIENSWKSVFPIKKQFNNKSEPVSLAKKYFPEMFGLEGQEVKALDLNKVFGAKD